MTVRIIVPIRYQGYHKPGDEIDMDKNTAKNAISAGLVEEVKHGKKK